MKPTPNQPGTLDYPAALLCGDTGWTPPVLHAAPGGRMERLLHQLAPQGRPITRLADLVP